MVVRAVFRGREGVNDYRNLKTGKPLNDRTKKDYLETARKDEQQAWRWANDPVRAQIEHHKASSAKKVYDWCQRQAA